MFIVTDLASLKHDGFTILNATSYIIHDKSFVSFFPIHLYFYSNQLYKMFFTVDGLVQRTDGGIFRPPDKSAY